SPQVPGPFNAFEHMVEAAFASNIFQYFLNDVPASGGCLVPFDFTTTKGSCVNANPDAAVALVVYLAPVLINSIQILMIKALYSVPEYRKDEYIALSISGASRALILSGENQWKRNITNILLVIPNSRAGGARHDKDGVDSAGFWYSGYAEAVDCEQDESTYPVITLWRRFASDRGGHGKFSGGRGISFGYMVKNTKKLAVTSIGVGHKFPPSLGVFGGYPATTSPLVIMRDALTVMANEPEIPGDDKQLALRFPGKALLSSNAIPLMTLQEGDLLTQCSGGGGGYGDVLERNPELVREDLASGKITPWTATNVYKVAIDTGSMQVDQELTEKMRREERARRIARGRPYADFAKEWQTKRPPQEALKFYGEWPIPYPDAPWPLEKAIAD
ncbi:MAG: hydantoinase B/oxoprolinase family protein, partial [Rhabdochlamydiaceae bacterium]